MKSINIVKLPYLAVATPRSIELDEVVTLGHHGLEGGVCELYKTCEGIWDCRLLILISIEGDTKRIIYHDKELLYFYQFVCRTMTLYAFSSPLDKKVYSYV